MLYFVFLAQSIGVFALCLIVLIVFSSWVEEAGFLDRMSSKQLRWVMTVLATIFALACLVAAARYVALPEHEFLLSLVAIFAPVIVGVGLVDIIWNPLNFYRFVSRHTSGRIHDWASQRLVPPE